MSAHVAIVQQPSRKCSHGNSAVAPQCSKLQILSKNTLCGIFITLHTMLSGAVYCYRSCLYVCVFAMGGVRTLLQPARAKCLHLS